MTEQPFTCGNGEALVAYLYGEISADERRWIDAHLSVCPVCAEEVVGLRATRAVLTTWIPPDAELGFRIVQEPPAAVVRIDAKRRRSWTAVPVWLSAAAAVLLVASGAAVANLHVRYDDSGLTVTTGWNRPASHETAAAAAPVAAASLEPTPWRRDLAELEQQLRHEIAVSRPQARPVAAGGASQNDLLDQVRVLLQQSEQRQQRELALRLTQVVRDVDTQRRADLVRIERSMGQMQGMTGAEVAQQRQLLNYLVRVSQQR